MVKDHQAEVRGDSFHFSALHKSAWEFVEQMSFFSASICCCCSRISSCCASSCFCCSLKALMNTTSKLFSFRSSTSPFSLRVIKRLYFSHIFGVQADVQLGVPFPTKRNGIEPLDNVKTARKRHGSSLELRRRK